MKPICFTTMIVILMLLCSNGIQAQTTQTQNNQFVIGSKDFIYSKILKEQREIWVYIPSSASDTTFSKQVYPVVYLLDGDSHFSSVVGMIKQLSSAYVCPEMIIVGIANTDRMRDFTPTHMNSSQFLDWVDTITLKNSGGGENFVSFLKKELIPHIDSLYPTAPYRMLIGHSAGGLAVINILIHHSNLFKAYVAIDPVMFWDNRKLLIEAKELLANNSYSGISFFLGIANTMKAGMDTVKVKNDTTNRTEQIRSVFELRNYINNTKQNQLRFAYKYYNNDNHTSVPLIAEYDALRFIFDCYHFDFFSDDYKNLENLYENISKHLGYKVNPPESTVNSLAYTFLYFKHFEEAFYLFKLNVSNYPNSWNVYDAMGDYYDTKGDKAAAIDNYKKVLSIKEIPDTRQKLEKLEGK